MEIPNTSVAPEATASTVEQTNLPSDNATPKDNGFAVSPEDLQEGKFLGKWTNPKEMAEHIKNIEDKYANLQRDIKNNEKQTVTEIEQTKAQIDAQVRKESTIQELAPQFMANGMQLNDEMMARLKEVGLTETEIKLGAYELRDAMDKHAEYVGGKENYDIIMDYHAKTMSPEDKIAFNKSIRDPNNSKALLIGLQAMYERDLASGKVNSSAPVVPTETDRIRGTAVPTSGLLPYSSKAELLRDKKYAESRNASAADKAKYSARLNITPENVWKN